MNSKQEIPINNVPTYLDGGDGNMWQSRDVWSEILSAPSEDIATRRYVRVSELISLLQSYGVNLVLTSPDSSCHGTIIES